MTADAPSLETRLAQLDAQLRQFESALRAHQQSHGHVRGLELELATIVERGATVVRDLASIGDQVRQAADAATREALAASTGRVQDFEDRAQHLLGSYANAVRAAQQAVARAEARIDAFDERVAHELAQAAREVREAAGLLREGASVDAEAQAGDVPVPQTNARWLVPALLAAILIVAGVAGYTWVARTVRDASARAAAAERQAHDTRRDATEQIASIDRTAQQATRDALASAVRAERTVGVLAAPDVRRMELLGQRQAPNAAGQALWSLQRGVVITGIGLPTLSATETYQVWLVTTRGVSSLGVASPDASGRVSAVFDLPPKIVGSIHGFMLTREPSGGSSRPSRTVVLAS